MASRNSRSAMTAPEYCYCGLKGRGAVSCQGRASSPFISASLHRQDYSAIVRFRMKQPSVSAITCMTSAVFFDCCDAYSVNHWRPVRTTCTAETRYLASRHSIAVAIWQTCGTTYFVQDHLSSVNSYGVFAERQLYFRREYSLCRCCIALLGLSLRTFAELDSALRLFAVEAR